ncbi:helix-turn-helix domain-containing protein [Streptomyces uncialis]|uniref:AraC-like ligand-binding domain-containing protein n=1 Tax=Streptomyces uncialis TaxID=1048205 RepID=UPI0033E3084F
MAFTEFDTARLPQEQRFDWWREVVSQGVAPARITSEAASDFTGSVGTLGLGRVRLTTMSFPALRSERTAEFIRRADPETYELTLILGGEMGFAQGRDDTRLSAGDITIWSSSRPYIGQSMSGPAIGAARAIILHLPRALVPLPEAKVDRLLAHGLSARSGMGRVLAQYLGSLVREGPALDEWSGRRLGETGLDLAAGFLARQLDAQEYLPPDARHATLLARIEVFIADNLADPGLTPAAIAARHHISVRLLHQLFRRRPETVAASIRRRRLERCHADLAEPRWRDVPVRDIGARWGLTDAGAFGRSFRAVYGLTPGEHRRRAIGGAAWG